MKTYDAQHKRLRRKNCHCLKAFSGSLVLSVGDHVVGHGLVDSAAFVTGFECGRDVWVVAAVDCGHIKPV